MTDLIAWTFAPTDEEGKRVGTAQIEFSSRYGRSPDYQDLKLYIALSFGGDLRGILAFWDGTMLADMPVEFRSSVQAADLWRERKIDWILGEKGLPKLARWEHRSVSACLKSPEHLRRAADELARYDSDGFALTSHEMDGDGDLIFTWHLRRAS